jgi:carboxylesterase type B
VLFLVHGGGLQFGSGEPDPLGPELIIQEDVIVVAFNYRLNALGFLSTADRHSPGNYALKDIILALQWVRDNIESFGGNPNDVTISGSSGGAVAAHALVLSQATTGLFHKAIISSGSMSSAWAFQSQPRVQAENLARNLGLFYRNNEELVAQLRQVSIERLMNAVGGLNADTHIIFSPMDFIVSDDPVDSPEQRLFTAPIETLIRRGNINRVPLLTGYTSDENLH